MNYQSILRKYYKFICGYIICLKKIKITWHAGTVKSRRPVLGFPAQQIFKSLQVIRIERDNIFRIDAGCECILPIFRHLNPCYPDHFWLDRFKSECFDDFYIQLYSKLFKIKALKTG